MPLNKRRQCYPLGLTVILLLAVACSPTESYAPRATSLAAPSVSFSNHPTPSPQPTPVVLGPLFDSLIPLSDAPIYVALELQIPALDVIAPMLGVGLTTDNLADSPKGPIGDDVWHTAFWYRGGSNPGDVGTATISGHVNDPLGEPEIFAYLEDLNVGDLIIVHYLLPNIEIRFVVDEVIVYSLIESSTPAILTQIFGAGPVAGLGPQPSLDGLSHLTLITCAGLIVDGRFDHHTVVYATRSN
jgi:sortase (surface protein transpeptidase)